MSGRSPKDVPASVRQRLLHLSREQVMSFDQVLQFYAIERFLFRLSKTPWSERLVVKGAAMLRVWNAPMARPTRDIDFLGYLPNTPEAVVAAVRECLSVEIAEDGLAFNDEVEARPVMVEDRYPGVRAVVRGHLDGALFRLQFDVAVDDAVVPDPGWVNYPTLLPGDEPRILAYMPATAMAEKFETIVSLGEITSRMKDFYDIWLLASTLDLDGPTCAAALRATFAHRGTDLPATIPPVLTDEYARRPEVAARWVSFLKKVRGSTGPSLETVLQLICDFALPIAIASADGPFDRFWPRGGPWHFGAGSCS